MSRSFHVLTRQQAAAFDFDVVTDVPARPPRKPDPAVNDAQPDPKPAAGAPVSEAAG